MTYYAFPELENLKGNTKGETIFPREYFDMSEQLYIIFNQTEPLTLKQVIEMTHGQIGPPHGTLEVACSSEDYWQTHVRNSIIVSTTDYCFHSTTFEEVKAQSCYVHNTYGLSPEALVCLAELFNMIDELENHSYVRICPELIFSLSGELKEALASLSAEQLSELARDWQKAVLKRYEAEEPYQIKGFWFGWITDYDLSHFTLEYFTELLQNIYELLRSCEEGETLMFSIDM